MLSMKMRVIHLFLVCLSTLSVSQSQDNSDQLARILHAYEEAVALLNASDPTMEQRIQFRSDWLERLQEAARANPKSDTLTNVLSEIVGLANGLGKFELSDAISKELASVSTSTEGKARWILEQAEISAIKYAASRDERDLNMAIDYYLACHEIATTSSSFGSKALQVQSVTLASEKSPMHLKEIGEKAMRALVSLDANPEVEAELNAQGFGIVRLLTALISVYSKLGDELQVNELIKKLSRQPPPLPQSLWITVLQSGDTMYPISAKPRIAFLERWKELSPFLRFYSAKAKFDIGAYSECVGDFVVLRDNHKLELLEQDHQALISKEGGYYGEVLLSLSFCYAKLGQVGDAKEQNTSAKTLIPNDPRIKFVEREIRNAENESEHGEPPARLLNLALILFLVFSIVGAALYLFTILRKRSR